MSWGTNIENEIPTNTNGNKTNPISTETTEETKEENRNLFRFIQGRDVRELPLQRIKMINENANTTFTYKVLENNFIGHEKIVKGAKVKEDGTIYFTNLTAKKNFADGSKDVFSKLLLQLKEIMHLLLLKINLFLLAPPNLLL